jgi:hypothetical protein
MDLQKPTRLNMVMWCIIKKKLNKHLLFNFITREMSASICFMTIWVAYTYRNSLKNERMNLYHQLEKKNKKKK